jgi:hypothetical protein
VVSQCTAQKSRKLTHSGAGQTLKVGCWGSATIIAAPLLLRAMRKRPSMRQGKYAGKPQETFVSQRQRSQAANCEFGAQRLAAYLLDLHECQDGAVMELPFSQHQLTARLGIWTRTLSRLLSGWSQEAITIKGDFPKNSVRKSLSYMFLLI